MNRRQLLGAGLASPLLLAGEAAAQPSPPIPIADMHFHSFFPPSTYDSRPVGAMMAAGGATLVAWSISGDGPWIHPRTLKQIGTPGPGAALARLRTILARIKEHMAEQGLKPVLAPRDVDRALAGEPHIVLAVEGASFIERDPGRVQLAYDLGIRHLQLVHYIRNPLGDFQTEPPEHNALTGLGREVVAECNRLGILVDLAHATPLVVRDTLALSRAPVVWSHSSVTRGPAPHPGLIIWRARQLSLETARAIAAKGGVIGLWVLSLDVGRTIEGYADRLAEMAEWLGENHVGFGTDINGLGPNFLLSSYAEVRRVIEHWQRQHMSASRIRKIAIGNYARTLKAALGPPA